VLVVRGFVIHLIRGKVDGFGRDLDDPSIAPDGKRYA
jgi:hypothetical protein